METAAGAGEGSILISDLESYRACCVLGLNTVFRA